MGRHAEEKVAQYILAKAKHDGLQAGMKKYKGALDKLKGEIQELMKKEGIPKISTDTGHSFAIIVTDKFETAFNQKHVKSCLIERLGGVNGMQLLEYIVGPDSRGQVTEEVLKITAPRAKLAGKAPEDDVPEVPLTEEELQKQLEKAQKRQRREERKNRIKEAYPNAMEGTVKVGDIDILKKKRSKDRGGTPTPSDAGSPVPPSAETATG